MYPFDVVSKRKQKPQQTEVPQPEFLVLGSEPLAKEYMPGRHLGLRYQSRYLTKRRVMRTIRRMKSQ